MGEIAPGATKTFDARLYVGPQEEDKLAALAPGLELVKDYGWFTILAKPLFWLLTQLHKLIGNWGWSIVGLVVLLKIAFYWLNAKAYSSMAKMKAINPRVMEMRERLKDKPQQMQQEMMRIYREEKVNPLGGCLPILVQMPFFIALYWVLLSTVEMSNAPWIGWINDLSATGPVLHPAAADDRHQPAADLAQPDAARSGAGADDVDHAASAGHVDQVLPAATIVRDLSRSIER